MKEKNVYIIAGCNGAGKTTASFTILPEIIHCKEFVNADEIARAFAISTWKSSYWSRANHVEQNWRVIFKQWKFCVWNKIIEAKQNNYTATLLFFWLKNIELAKERVKIRVSEGGHNIESDIIERRYIKGIINLFEIYLPIVDGALIFDNSFGKPELLASKTADGQLKIIKENKFNELKCYYDNSRKTNWIIRQNFGRTW